MRLNEINYKGANLIVRKGAWDDVMNSCFYNIVDEIAIGKYKYFICIDKDGIMFARNDYRF